MKYRKWFLFLGVVALCGCAGLRTEKSDEAADGIASEEPLEGDEVEASGPSKSLSAPGGRSSRSADKKYQALSSAVRSGNESAVVGEASKILATNGSDPVALNALAMFQFTRGRVGAAKILLERAFEKNQSNASLLNNFALVQASEGDMAAALQTLKKAYRIDDDNPDVLGNLGSLYVQGGDYTKALPLLEQAYRANKSNVAIANNYAIALRANKSYDKAAKIYEELIKTNSRDVNLHLNYAILLIDFMNKGKDGLPLAVKVKFLETERKEIIDRANALEKKARGELK